MIEMAEESPLNSTTQVDEGESAKNAEKSIKIEAEVSVKPEPQECAVCSSQACVNFDICATKTGSGTLITDFLCKFTDNDLATNSSRHVCKSCHDLINVLEQAEIEYLKLKEAFETIISKNPLFDNSSQQNLGPVKFEVNDNVYGNLCETNGDSEDEPLAVTKKKRRKVDRRKKKVCAAPKRKPRAKNSKTSWKANEPVLSSYEDNVLKNVKREDSVDGSDGSQLNNGLDGVLKLEVQPFDDDDDDDDLMVDFGDDFSIGEHKRSSMLVSRPRKNKALTLPKIRKKRETKVMHQCDQCDAKYTSIRRLELHLEKHSAGKPPYICEVCGARYKHKRACDIHVALHKGISDWKCEECNKLFPSKGALQRHNNIHTGKLNYQCDLCGKSFIHTSSFKMHKLSHSGVKPHACEVCGLALMTRSHLKRHARVHSGEKRHECHVCGKRFSERYNLAAHTKAHEGAGDLPPGLPQPPRRRLFRCAYCPERFERRYLLERHCSSAHGRPLERAPPTPRNTMSKLLKAQARQGAQDAAAVPKEERSPESRASSVPHKLQLASPAPPSATSWADAFQAGFGLRGYTH